MRWVRSDGREARQRFFRRRGDAMLWAAKMMELGKPTATFETCVEWTRAGEPDQVDLRVARGRIR